MQCNVNVINTNVMHIQNEVFSKAILSNERNLEQIGCLSKAVSAVIDTSIDHV